MQFSGHQQDQHDQQGQEGEESQVSQVSQPARQLTRKKRTGRTVLLGFLAVFLVVAVVAGGFVFNLAHSFDSKTHKIADAFPAENLRPAASHTGATNILLLGSDSRGDTLDAAGEGDASDQRSDSMMLLHVPADHKKVYMMSIMRDTWVDIPGHGEAKINAAMAYGGVPLTVQTVEGLFKSRIDHVAIVNFDGFKAITDALGGVPVDVPMDFTSDDDFTYTKGRQVLDGDQALSFVRERHAFADGDYQRVKDQQTFLKGVLAQTLTLGTVTNPAKMAGLVDAVSPYLSVDKGFNAATLGSLGLGLGLRNVRPADVVSFTLPNLGTGTSADGQSIVIKDDDAIASIADAMGSDTLGTYVQAAGLGH